jgi:hypothetical protein
VVLRDPGEHSVPGALGSVLGNLPVLLLSPDDRKLVLAARFLAVEDYELPDEMVQGGAKVMDHVPEDEPPFRILRLLKDLQIDNLLSGFRIE